jgi:hypothetical protein
MSQANANKFSNCREWRSFLSQSAAAFPSVMAAVKASHAWLSGRAANTYTGLLVKRATRI